MNFDERLKLQDMIKQNNVQDHTSKIRKLKHSSLLKKDIELLLSLKNESVETMMSECLFLYTYYTDLFNKIKKDEIDVSILFTFLNVLKKIEDEEIDQHEGSYEVGMLLKKIYVDSALKKADKLNENAKESEYKGAQENISWKDWKLNNN